MKEEKYLPLGSIVMLKGGKHKLSIMGFCLVIPEKKRQYDYVGVFYPEGYVGVDNLFVFDHDDIDEVFSIGYTDHTDKEFKEKLTTAIKNYSTDSECHTIDPKKYEQFLKNGVKNE